MLCKSKCAKNAAERPTQRHDVPPQHVALFSSTHRNLKFSLSHTQTRTCDAWETLHAAVAAPAPSPNAFAVEKHASAAAATQIRLYILPTILGKTLTMSERCLPVLCTRVCKTFDAASGGGNVLIAAPEKNKNKKSGQRSVNTKLQNCGRFGFRGAPRLERGSHTLLHALERVTPTTGYSRLFISTLARAVFILHCSLGTGDGK